MAPKQAPKPYHHGDLRNALIEAALLAVTRKGVEAFSLREVAREVGVSPSAAYRHFPDKAALLCAVAMDGFQRMSTEMLARMARAQGSKRGRAAALATFEATGVAYVRFAVAHPAHFRVMFGPHGAGAAAAAHPSRSVAPEEPAEDPSDPYALLIGALDELVVTGVIPSARRQGAEIVAWSSVHGLSCLLVDGAIDPRSAGGVEALAEKVVAGVVAGITGKPA